MSSLNYSTEHYDDPKPLINYPSSIIGITISFMVASWCCVAFRLYTRIKIVRSPGWDDLFVVCYVSTTTVSAIAVCLDTKYGLGEHFLLIPPDVLSTGTLLGYIINGCYPMSTAFIKLSLICQFLRLYEPGSRLRILCIITAVFTALWGFAFAFLAWFPCFPVQAFWDPSVQGACYGYGSREPYLIVAMFTTHSATNMILDIIVLALPIPLYFQSDKGSRVRLGLVVLLGMGVLINVFSIWRFANIVHDHLGIYPIFDPNWYTPINIVLSVLEVDIASICACVPIFWPVISKKIDHIMVTKEVKITHEDIRHDQEYELGGGIGHARSKSMPDSQERHLSRQGSEAELKQGNGDIRDVPPTSNSPAPSYVWTDHHL